MSSAVAHALPPSILALFAPRPPLEFKPGIEKRSMLNYTTISQFVVGFEDPSETPAPTVGETVAERRERVKLLKDAQAKEKLEAEIEKYDPASDDKIKGDPYKTLFVSRLSYDTTEVKLRKEFEQFGPVKRIRIVHDNVSGKARGYGFVEFEHERDMKTAYKQADGKKIDGRRVLVDVERGRTVRNWRPRRLGGGLGSTRAGGKGVAVKNSGRDIGLGGGGTPVSKPGSGLAWSSETRGADRDRGGSDRGGDRERDRGGDRGSSGGGGLQWSTERRDDRDRGDRGDRDRGSGGRGGRDERERRDRDRERERDRDRDRREKDEHDKSRERARDSDRDRERDRRSTRDRDRSDRDRDRDRRGDEKDRDRRGEDRDRDRRTSAGGDSTGFLRPPPPPPPPTAEGEE